MSPVSFEHCLLVFIVLTTGSSALPFVSRTIQELGLLQRHASVDCTVARSTWIHRQVTWQMDVSDAHDVYTVVQKNHSDGWKWTTTCERCRQWTPGNRLHTLLFYFSSIFSSSASTSSSTSSPSSCRVFQRNTSYEWDENVQWMQLTCVQERMISTSLRKSSETPFLRLCLLILETCLMNLIYIYFLNVFNILCLMLAFM